MRVERPGDGEGRRRQQLAQHQRHQVRWPKATPAGYRDAGNRRPACRAGLRFLRREVLHERQSAGVGDVGRHLAPERAVAEGLAAAPSASSKTLAGSDRELLAEALEVAERCSSMKLTRPNSSSREFCSGVAVSSSLGAAASAA